MMKMFVGSFLTVETESTTRDDIYGGLDEG